MLAWSLFAVASAATMAMLVFHSLGPGSSVYGSARFDSALGLALLSFPAVGAVVASRRPSNPLGWLFCAFGVILALQGAASAYTLQADPRSLPGGELVAWAFTWLTSAAVIPGPFLLLLFPDGRLPSARWKGFAWVVGTVGVVHLLLAAFSPGPLPTVPEVGNPFGIDAAAGLGRMVSTVTLGPYFWPAA